MQRLIEHRCHSMSTSGWPLPRSRDYRELSLLAYCTRFPASCAGLGSGAVWRKIFIERIRDPLEMGMFYNSATNPRIAGGHTSRLSDDRKFWQMIVNRGEFNGVRVLSPQAIDEMLRDQTNGAPVYYSAAQPDIRYGLGVWRARPDTSVKRMY